MLDTAIRLHPQATSPPPRQNSTPPQVHALYYGRSPQPLVELAPDDVWPGMFRLHWPCGAVSDMTNLSRAVDAAVTICERGPPARNRRLFGWQRKPSKTPSWAPPMRFRDKPEPQPVRGNGRGPP